MNKLTCIAALAVAASTLGACTAEQPAEESGSTESKIIGGAGDSTHPSVAYLRSVIAIDPQSGAPISVGGCTATLIGPSVMITAAHCATGPRMWNEVSFDDVPNIFAAHGAPGWISAGLVVHPLYDGDTSHGHDVALALLAGSPGRPIVELGGAPGVGATVTAVGYGMSVYGHDGAGSGTRRVASFPVLGLTGSEIIAGPDQTCHGDSGGPLFVGPVLVGTTSYGETQDCHGTDHFMRIDDNLDFIRRFVPSY